MPAAWLIHAPCPRAEKAKKRVGATFVNLLLLILLRSYQTGYWRADKARMSSVSSEESPVFNCSSLLTTSRDQDSECVRLGPAGRWGLGVQNTENMERRVSAGRERVCMKVCSRKDVDINRWFWLKGTLVLSCFSTPGRWMFWRPLFLPQWFKATLCGFSSSKW